jgi:hypothetical protein
MDYHQNSLSEIMGMQYFDFIRYHFEELWEYYSNECCMYSSDSSGTAVSSLIILGSVNTSLEPMLAIKPVCDFARFGAFLGS